MRAKGSLLGHFSAPGPIRKLRDEVTSAPGRASYFRRKQAARMGELLWNLHPSFAINKREGVEGKRSSRSRGLELRRKKRKEEERRKNKVETLLNHIRDRFLHRSSFVLHPVSAYFKDLNLIYGPLGLSFIVLYIFISFFDHR